MVEKTGISAPNKLKSVPFPFPESSSHMKTVPEVAVEPTRLASVDFESRYASGPLGFLVRLGDEIQRSFTSMKRAAIARSL